MAGIFSSGQADQLVHDILGTHIVTEVGPRFVGGLYFEKGFDPAVADPPHFKQRILVVAGVHGQQVIKREFFPSWVQIIRQPLGGDMRENHLIQLIEAVLYRE